MIKQTIFKRYSLRDHLRAMRVGQTCQVFLRDYSYGVMRTTCHYLKKEGLEFSVHKRMDKKGTKPVDKISVTRLK